LSSTVADVDAVLTPEARSWSARHHTLTREQTLTHSADTTLQLERQRAQNGGYHSPSRWTVHSASPDPCRGSARVDLRGRRIDLVPSPVDMTISRRGTHALVSNHTPDRPRPHTHSSATTCLVVGERTPLGGDYPPSCPRPPTMSSETRYSLVGDYLLIHPEPPNQSSGSSYPLIGDHLPNCRRPLTQSPESTYSFIGE
jgi:hypothetical protein